VSKDTIKTGLDFIRAIIREDVDSGKQGGAVVTRFPPEPNGFLHIGHAKSICLNFGVAEEFGGRCNLRFDDTDPAKEDTTYVEAIKDNVHWLGFDWGEGLYNASDYFEQLYRFAIQLIERGRGYVCSLSEEEIRAYRGTVTQPGRESPYRNRSIEENLDLFTRMRQGEFPDGKHVLRAKIDMASPNMKMRDPVVYRIRHVTHHRTGDEWPIYPMYDFAHPLSDALEGVTHSLCTLEFENNRAFYDWILAQVDVPSNPRQIEFARLNLNYTVMSKRKLLQLVEEKHVRGWDDPRMPTIAGLKRRGYTPESIRNFCHSVGIAKSDNTVEMSQLEYFIRDDLNPEVPRVLCVERPLKVVITNYPDDRVEELEAPYYPHDVPKEGSRSLPFTSEIYIERDDFLEEPPRNYYRLAPGREVRLRYAYIIKCDEVVKDSATGAVLELHCSYDPETRSGSDQSGKKVQGTIHWVSVAHALPAELRLYDRLFSVENPESDPTRDYREFLNPGSLETVLGYVEPSLRAATPGERFQFERQGYFSVDLDSTPEALVFNRIVTLRDSWLKLTVSADTAVKRRRSRKQQSPGKAATTPTTGKRIASASHAGLTAAQKAKVEDYRERLGLSPEDALLLASDDDLTSFFEKAIHLHDNPKAIGNWIINELRPARRDTPLGTLPFGPAAVAKLIALVDDQVISTRTAKEVFAIMLAEGGDPAQIVEGKGLQQVADTDQLEPIIEEIIAAHPENVTHYRQGKTNLLGFFVGQVMKATGGKANPQLVHELLRSKLATGC
jgi:glutaminyl-tRNA synthetase